MKKFLLRFLWILYIWLPSVAILPSMTIAQECTGFWCNAYVPWVGVIWTEKKQESALLDTIKATINWILAILATVALVICLYAWFQMLTSGSDSKWYENWLKILKNAAIGLVIIGLAWLIVSAIFWFINLQTWNNSMLWWSTTTNSQ